MSQPFRADQANRHSDGFFDDRCRKRQIHVRERRGARAELDAELDAAADTHWYDDVDDDDWVWDALDPQPVEPVSGLRVPLAEVLR